MTAFSAFGWEEVAAKTLTGDLLRVKRVASVSGVEIVAGVDSYGQRHILVKLEDEMPDPPEQRTRGLSLRVRDLAEPGADHGRYIDIQCHEAAGHAALGAIGNEIIESMASESHDPGAAVTRVVSRWRRFWGQIPQSLLSVQEQIGLFAELWFLLTWLATRLPLSQAVSRWRGPLGARHDFESPGISFEVKASMAVRGPSHRIHGLTQLEPPESGSLFLFSLQVRNEDGAANSLPGIVRQGQRLAASDLAVAERLEDLLAKAGYSASHEAEYEKLRLRIIAEGLYRVSEDFPRLVRTSFPGGVPGGVDEIDYDINLGAFGHLLVASRATEPFPV